MSHIELGIVYHPCPEELEEFSSAVSKLTGLTPREEKLFGFAGPNEVVQIILDTVSWALLFKGSAAFLGTKFLSSYVSELGKQAATKTIETFGSKEDKDKEIFLELVEAIIKLRQKGQTVTVAVKLIDTPRNAGFVIETEDPKEIAEQMSLVALYTEDIQKRYEELKREDDKVSKTGNNPDMSLKIEITDGGKVLLMGNEVVLSKKG
ncbi:hypothetical protein [Paraglaciecola arctica]|uniref:hypothetical protein n=1 Tax=Paraglaciecola arctica TaxID=1128911 RepID=UPI001C07A650|nr:hypothetical protein [Paraglaciecola arctica]MBU3003651.1 hypothetical protein [Paraglaciecola arctica]